MTTQPNTLTLSDLRDGDEKTLREGREPGPKTPKELVAVVNALVGRQHDYGTCVYAMSIAATAAFNFVAHKLGVTGFQASCADLDVLRRTRSMRGPFMIVKAEDYLYPQYDLRKKLEDFIGDNSAWFAEEAKKRLAELDDEFPAHPAVLARWKKLAGVEP